MLSVARDMGVADMFTGSVIDARRTISGEGKYGGAGAFRRAWINPSETVVYKVGHSVEVDEQNMVEADHAAVAIVRGVPYIAPTVMFNVNGRVVNAQPYIEFDGETAPWDVQSAAYRIWEQAGFADLKGANCRWDGQNLWLTDLQFMNCGLASHARAGMANFEYCHIRGWNKPILDEQQSIWKSWQIHEPISWDKRNWCPRWHGFNAKCNSMVLDGRIDKPLTIMPVLIIEAEEWDMSVLSSISTIEFKRKGCHSMKVCNNAQDHSCPDRDIAHWCQDGEDFNWFWFDPTN